MAGALGLGGGIVVVPGLVFFFQLTGVIPAESIMHVAIASSLAVILFTSLASLNSHRRMGEIAWPVFSKLSPGLALGACLGALSSAFIPTSVLKIIFTVFLFGVALKMVLDLHRSHEPHFLPTWLYVLSSLLIGCIAAILGVGGGVLLIPFLTYVGIESRKIAPLSNLGGLIIATVGMVLLMIGGFNEMAHVPYTLGYIYWPAVLGIAIPSSLIAPFGAKLNYILPMHYLKYGFIVILILTAIKMLV
ncbi:sulfite exporter TauE/SafE family protein [Legionella sp. km772]|nr:sulfite exporter TauE/SafE family protein [Legionella sp. km772]